MASESELLEALNILSDSSSRDEILFSFLYPLVAGGVIGSESRSGSGQPPASKESIKALPEVKVFEIGKECLVCLEEFEFSDVAKEMPCKHRFHSEYVEKWLHVHGTCPACRFKMPVKEKYSTKYEEEEDDEEVEEEDEGEEEEMAETFQLGQLWMNLLHMHANSEN